MADSTITREGANEEPQQDHPWPAERAFWETAREIPHIEAREAARRLINSHFRNPDTARVSIPANPDQDDDLVLHSYIRQQARKSGSTDALAQLAEIPPAGSEERDFWLMAAEQHGFTAPGESALPTLWMASDDAILKLLSEARKQGQRDALTAGIQAGLDAAIRGIDATILNMGGECSRRGFQDPETGEVPCEGEEDRGCACSEALELGARLIKNLRTCDVAKIAELATGGARHG